MVTHMIRRHTDSLRETSIKYSVVTAQRVLQQWSGEIRG